MYKTKIKICGIRTINILECCIKNNVDFFGLIFYPKSPRNINLDEALNLIKYSQNKNISAVGVFVNEPLDNSKYIINKLQLKYIQLHGKENFDYIAKIKNNQPVKVIKNIAIKSSEDFLKTKEYSNTDIFLFDYKPNNNELPGGNSKRFSWDLIRDIKVDKPWFLSGGININNIKEIKNYAIPYGIDISSGVEDKLGIKNNYKIISLLKIYDSK